MTVKVTFEFDTAADAATFLQDMDAPEGSAQTAAPRGRGRPRKDAAAAPTQAAAPATSTAAAPAAQTAAAPAQAVAPAQTAAEPAKVIPINAVIDVLAPLADLGGEHHEKAKAILAKYGATTLGSKPGDPNSKPLDPKFYAAVIEECKASMPRPTSTSLI